MPTVVYCWELGAGYGHVAPFSPVAKRFVAEGWRVVLIVKELFRAQPFFDINEVEILQAPAKRSTPAPVVSNPPTYGHILLNLGYEDAEELTQHVGAWRDILTSLNPDLIVFDHSPTAILASRGLLARKASIGTGFCCPRAERPMPLMATWQSLPTDQCLRDEQRLVSQINMALKPLQAPVIRDLSDMFHDLDANLLTTWPELDHYGQREDCEYFGTWSVNAMTTSEELIQQWTQKDGRKLFAYLKPMPTLPDLVRVIGSLPVEALLVIDKAAAAELQASVAANVVISNQPVPMEPVLKHCDLAILNGNHGTVSEFLLAGIPSLLIPLTFEQTLTAIRLQAEKLAAASGPERIDNIQLELRELVQRPEYLTGIAPFRQRYSGTTDQQRIDRAFEALLNCCR